MNLPPLTSDQKTRVERVVERCWRNVQGTTRWKQKASVFHGQDWKNNLRVALTAELSIAIWLEAEWQNEDKDNFVGPDVGNYLQIKWAPGTGNNRNLLILVPEKKQKWGPENYGYVLVHGKPDEMKCMGWIGGEEAISKTTPRVLRKGGPLNWVISPEDLYQDWWELKLWAQTDLL